jgi:hypothetical protein
MFGRRSIGEIDTDLLAGIGHDHQIAGGTEQRIPDRPTRSVLDWRASIDAVVVPRLKLRSRKSLAANMISNVVGTNENQFLALHDALRWFGDVIVSVDR